MKTPITLYGYLNSNNSMYDLKQIVCSLRRFTKRMWHGKREFTCHIESHRNYSCFFLYKMIWFHEHWIYLGKNSAQHDSFYIPTTSNFNWIPHISKGFCIPLLSLSLSLSPYLLLLSSFISLLYIIIYHIPVYSADQIYRCKLQTN